MTRRKPDTVTPIGDWGERALCKGRADWEIPQRDLLSPDPTFGPRTTRAKTMCFECPVFEDCYEWIMPQHDDPCPCHVVAGMTPRERRAERKRTRLRAAIAHRM